MALGWNEIKERAVRFSKEWAEASNEEADAQSFLVEFFNVFGISNRRVATFEHKVKKLGDFDGYIDLLWKGTILIEMKSRGKNLDKAYQQAKDYLPGLKQHELPKYLLVSDFENFRLYDLDENTESDFKLTDFVNHVQLFGFIAGYQKKIYKSEDPVNIEAAYLMGKLHDALKEAGYTGHELEKYLVRLLFCLFADDTTIFEPNIFQDYLINKTNEDGTDLGMHLAQIFQVLNTPDDKRQKTLDESLVAFPYVNGHLFSEQLSFASFNTRMRQTLMECCYLDWSKISPAIFGSMFQSVMDEKQRRNLGAHYTSEKNILKVIKPLFVDQLWQEFEKIKDTRSRLTEFHKKIASLRFLDPACGCGNFLIIAYREIRELEFAVIKQMNMIDNKVYGQQVLDVRMLFIVDVDKYFGIEYDEFASQIAQVAMWMIDHQMNMKAGLEFGKYFARIPLVKSAHIIHGNALSLDWDKLLNEDQTVVIEAKEADIIIRSQSNDPSMKYGKVKLIVDHYKVVDQSTFIDHSSSIKFDYILGNPPFTGKQLQSQSQKSDMEIIFGGVKGAGVLDYVTAWYLKAAQYLKKHNTAEIDKTNNTRIAFVSTNSVSQGEQVGILWNELFNRYQIKIHFAHRTFKWGNEAKGNAAVHVVIIGFSNFDIPEKLLYEYEDIKGEPHEIIVKNINPYLIGGNDFIIPSRQSPICDVPPMMKGSQPTDGGNLILSQEEMLYFVGLASNNSQYLRKYVGSEEFINGNYRWCLWMQDFSLNDVRENQFIKKRSDAVRQFRLQSTKEATRKWANKPLLFTENRQPEGSFIIVPSVSSELRNYIPIGLLDSSYVVSNLAFVLPNATLFHFGVLMSVMHMAWAKYVCGRLKSDFRYSNTIVYNNYPWPENPTEKQKSAIEKAAQKVLDARTQFPGCSLADYYDPLFMPSALVDAHSKLDKAVDLAYRPQPFINETKRIEFLFELYDKYTAGLFAKEKKKKK